MSGEDPVSQARAQVRDGLTALYHLTRERVYLQLLALFEELEAHTTQPPAPLPPLRAAVLTPITVGGVRLDPERREVARGKDPISLTPNETRLLYLLMSYPDQVLTAAQIVQQVWGPGSDVGVVKDTVRRLRAKVEDLPGDPRYIVTVPGVGYTFRARGHEDEERE